MASLRKPPMTGDQDERRVGTDCSSNNELSVSGYRSRDRVSAEQNPVTQLLTQSLAEKVRGTAAKRRELLKFSRRWILNTINLKWRAVARPPDAGITTCFGSFRAAPGVERVYG